MPNSRRKGGGGGWRRAVPALQLGLRGEGIQRRTPIIPPLSLPTMQTKSTTPNLGAWEKGPVGSLACGMDGWRRWPKWSSCCSRLRVGVAGDCPLPARGRLTPKAAEAAGWRAGNPPFPVGLGEPQAAAENGGVGGVGGRKRVAGPSPIFWGRVCHGSPEDPGRYLGAEGGVGWGEKRGHPGTPSLSAE